MSIAIPPQAFAIRDTVTGAVSGTGKFAKDVGKTVGIRATAKEIDQDVTVALDTLLKNSVAAAKLAKTAKAILVYPRILKIIKEKER